MQKISPINFFSDKHYKRKNAGALVNFFITHVRWKILENFTDPLLRYNAELPEEVIEVLDIFKNSYGNM